MHYVHMKFNCNSETSLEIAPIIGLQSGRKMDVPL